MDVVERLADLFVFRGWYARTSKGPEFVQRRQDAGSKPAMFRSFILNFVQKKGADMLRLPPPK
jgi:hypothetical protein